MAEADVGVQAKLTADVIAGEVIEYGPTQRIFTQPDDTRTEDYVTGRFG